MTKDIHQTSKQNPSFGGRSGSGPQILMAAGALLVGALLMALKFYLYRYTGSTAVFSDALESIINVVASAFVLVSVWLSAKPPDKSHPYGHGKIEFFSAGFEGALIIIAAFGVFRMGIARLLHPQPLLNLENALLILLGINAVNLALAIALIRVGRRTSSLALIADGRHILTDVYTTGGVLVGLLLVRLTGWFWVDGAFACLVGVNILWSGGKLVRKSFRGLMDAAEPELLEEISTVLSDHRKDTWIDIHQLRAWRSGRAIHIDFHLILPRDLTLEEAHHEAKELEAVIVEHFKGAASPLIHMDPCTDNECPICRARLCSLRAKEQSEESNWDADTMTLNGGGSERLRSAGGEPW